MIISDAQEWAHWHKRLIRYWQSLGVVAGSGLVDPGSGDVFTIANLLADLEAHAKEIGVSRVLYAQTYLYHFSHGTAKFVTRELCLKFQNPFNF